MRAAVLHALGAAPRCDDFPDPVAETGEVIVHMRAASLKNVDRMIAQGSHYQRAAALPAICGVDGVGVLDDGTRVFCGGCRPPYGTMAERAVVSRAWCMPIPRGVDDAIAAALPNPALSSWLPLVWRAGLEPGETVLIMGATGVAGKLAIEIARHLGAGRVVAAGRNAHVLGTLTSIGADAVIPLEQTDDDLAAHFAREARAHHFDVVLDYLWGRPTEILLNALTGHDLKAEGRATRVIEIGEMAGPAIALPAAVLRSTAIQISGSGGGGVSPQAILETFPKMWALAAAGGLHVDVDRIPLADVEAAWNTHDASGRRAVIIP